jgi:hypothetical protein
MAVEYPNDAPSERQADQRVPGDIFRLGVRGSLSGRLRPVGAGNNIASHARLWLARLPRRSPHTHPPRSVDPKLAESVSSAPAWSATVIPRA